MVTKFRDNRWKNWLSNWRKANIHYGQSPTVGWSLVNWFKIYHVKCDKELNERVQLLLYPLNCRSRKCVSTRNIRSTFLFMMVMVFHVVLYQSQRSGSHVIRQPHCEKLRCTIYATPTPLIPLPLPLPLIISLERHAFIVKIFRLQRL